MAGTECTATLRSSAKQCMVNIVDFSMRYGGFLGYLCGISWLPMVDFSLTYDADFWLFYWVF